MTARRGVLAALLAILGAHWAWRTHLPAPETVRQLTWVRLWGSLVVVVGITVAVIVRTRWLLVSSARAVAALQPSPRPARLEQALSESGPVPYEVSCVASEWRTAFAVGGLRPHIYVTSGLVGHLDVQALAAVLAHEAEHARRHDPARRALWHACADLLWQLPIARWWVWLSCLRSELAADGAATVRCGEAALARALLASTAPVGTQPAPVCGPARPGTDAGGRTAGATAACGPGVAFHTSADRRAARLLGEELPPVRPRWPMLLATLGWLALALAAFSCFTELAAAYVVY